MPWNDLETKWNLGTTALLLFMIPKVYLLIHINKETDACAHFFLCTPYFERNEYRDILGKLVHMTKLKEISEDGPVDIENEYYYSFGALWKAWRTNATNN